MEYPAVGVNLSHSLIEPFLAVTNTKGYLKTWQMLMTAKSKRLDHMDCNEWKVRAEPERTCETILLVA